MPAAQKKISEQEWVNLVLQCRNSGFSDREWCDYNRIPLSTFYYHVRKLKKKDYCIPPAAGFTARQQVQEVVPLIIEEEPASVKADNSFGTESTAIRIFIRQFSLEITNHADQDTIRRTLSALEALC